MIFHFFSTILLFLFYLSESNLLKFEIVGPSQQIRSPAFRNAFPKSYTWSHGIIPYEFLNISEHLKENFHRAAAQLRKYTCINWIPKRPEDGHWVKIWENQNLSSCGWASVGNVGGYLSVKCGDYNTMAHEMMHTIGFNHEHLRKDRNEGMYMFFQNMDIAKNEEGYDAENRDLLGLPYDHRSILHYRNFKTSLLSKHYEMLAKDPCEDIGTEQRDYSRLDYLKINKRYECENITGHTFPVYMDEKPVYDLGFEWANNSGLFKCFREGNKVMPKAIGCVVKQTIEYKNGDVFTISGKQCKCDISKDEKEAKITVLEGCEKFVHKEWYFGRYVHNYECIESEKKLVEKIIGCATPLSYDKVIKPTGFVKNGELIGTHESTKFYCEISADGSRARSKAKI